MEKVVNLTSLGISKMRAAVFPPAPTVLPERPDRTINPNGWQEDYLIGASDIDARWYYERRYWRS
jgi:hypothetical protein